MLPGVVVPIDRDFEVVLHIPDLLPKTLMTSRADNVFL